MYCEIRGSKIYYEEYGEGKPILLIHGFSLDGRMMKGCMEPALKGFDLRRVYIDLPGMGRSQAPEWIKGSDDMLDAVCGFAESVLPDANFLVAGESYGGYLSRGLVYRMKERIDGLLLICPVVLADRAKRTLPEKTVFARDESLFSELLPSVADEFKDVFVIQTRPAFERFEEEILPGLRAADKAFLDRVHSENYGFSFDVDDPQKARFEKPALLFAGRQDNATGYRDLFGIIENYPRATFAVLDAAGHNLQIEQSGLFCSLVSEWLDRIEGRFGI